MADKITPKVLTSGFASIDALNTNFADIATELNNKVLYRDTTEPNQMDVSLDMNSERIINLSAPQLNTDAARLQDVLAGVVTTDTALPSPTAQDGKYLGASGGAFVFQDTSNLDWKQAGTGAATRKLETKIREAVSLKDFGAVGDGIADDTVAIQAALDFAEANDKALFAPEGKYKTTAQLDYTVTSTDEDTANGLVLFGAGMGKTVFLPKFSSAAFVFVQSTSPFFAKNCRFAEFTILGETITGTFASQVGIRMKGCWWTSFESVRIIKLNGTALLIGDDTATDPDTTANLGVYLTSCEFDENVGGILNPVNNNAPFLLLSNCGIRNNSQFGIIANSSYTEIRGGSISFNGILDASNASGGIIFEEKLGTTFSVGFRAKGLLIEGVELDTNYPFQVDAQRGDTLEIRHCSIQFRDYSTIDWASAGITVWPLSQIRVGGSVINANDQAWNVKIHHNRVSIKSDAQISFNAAGHSIVHVLPNGYGTHYADQMHNLELGVGVLGTDFFIMKEDDKAGTGRTDRKFYPVVDYPMGNISESQVIAGFKTFTPQVLPSFEAFHGRNQHFAFNLADDAVKTIVVPSISSEVGTGRDFGQANIVANGISTLSSIVTYRATTSPECVAMATAPGTLVETTTGVLTGVTGTDTKLTISVDTAGNLYVENRTGVSRIVFVSFLMAPGPIDQI